MQANDITSGLSTVVKIIIMSGLSLHNEQSYH